MTYSVAWLVIFSLVRAALSTGCQQDFDCEPTSYCSSSTCELGLPCSLKNGTDLAHGETVEADCNTCFCRNGELTCSDMNCSALCQDDGDCGDNAWCREAKVGSYLKCSSHRVCTAKVAEGSSCGGKTLSCYRDECQAGLECVVSEDMRDATGTCVMETTEEVRGAALAVVDAKDKTTTSGLAVPAALGVVVGVAVAAVIAVHAYTVHTRKAGPSFSNPELDESSDQSQASEPLV